MRYAPLFLLLSTEKSVDSVTKDWYCSLVVNEERTMTTDRRYEVVRCDKCGNTFQRIDFRGAPHAFFCDGKESEDFITFDDLPLSASVEFDTYAQG